MEVKVKFEESDREFVAAFGSEQTLTAVGIEEIFAYNESHNGGETSHYAIRLTDGREYPFYVTNGKDGEAGKAPRLRINPDTNLWEVDYIGDATWESLGVPATGPKGDKGDKGDKGESAVMVVIIDDYDWTADYSALEILSYMQKAPVIGYLNGGYREDVMTLCGVRDEVDGDMESHYYATFKTAADENGVWKEYTIDDNKKVTVKEMSLSSAVETLVVTVDDAEMMASHTSAQIYEHIQNGGAVAIKYGASSYTPSSVSESVVSCLFGVTGECVSLLEIYDDGSVVTPENFYAPIDQIPDVGDIEAALDAILAIQNQLMGGDA